MKNINTNKIWLLLLILFCSQFSLAQKKIILDTDMGPDCDDAVALSILHVMADKGEATILGIACCTSDQYGAPTIDAINTYYGRPNIPVGTLKESGFLTGPWYTQDIATSGDFPHDLLNGSNAPDAVSLYRQILSQQSDHSVTFVSVGPLRNLRNLLQSGGDQYSSLSGRDLVAAKVVELVTMGGDYPTGNEWNFNQDGGASSYVVSNWPTPITFSGAAVGGACWAGSDICSKTPTTNPVRRALEDYPGVGCGNGRDVWDPSAVLYAVRGLSSYYTAVTGGKAVVSGDGSNTWQSNAGNMAYLIKNSCQAITDPINELLYTVPGTNCNILATGITVSPTTATINTGANTSLSATVNPTNACNRNVNWSSSNTAVATVNANGVVSGVSAGTATITAKTQDGTNKTATCSVTVNAATTTTYEAESGTWGGTNTSKYANGSASGGYLIGNITTQNSYIQLSNVSGNGGTATLIVGAFYNSSANSANLYVNGSLVQKINFSTNANYSGYEMSGVSVTLNSGTSNTIKLINDSGTSSSFNDIDYIKIIVTGSAVSVTGVSVSPTSASVAAGSTSTLTATVTPSNATNKNVTWSSSNTAVATVDSNGIVTGVAAGTATITVTTADASKTATSSITVTSSSVAVTSVSVSPTSASVAVGATTTLSATVAPSNATNKNVTWSSSNTSTATVSSTGVVTGVAAGTATITVTTQDGAKTAISAITVTTSSTPTTTKYEAESGTWGGTNTSKYANGNASGGFLIGNITTQNSYVQVSNVNGAGGNATLVIGAFYNSSANSANLYVNGSLVQKVNFSTNSSYSAYQTASISITLSSGSSNVIKLINDSGNTSSFNDIDYISVTTNTSTVAVTGVSVSPSTVSVVVGATSSLSATVSPSNASNKNVTWSSSNTSIATVSSSGVVTGVAQGSATITATTQDGAKTATSAITVTSSGTSTTTKYEAENGTWTGNNTNKYSNPSASGGYLIGNITTQNSSIQISGVNGGTGGNATLVVGAFYGSSENSANLYVNGSLVQKINFTTNSNYSPYEFTGITIPLSSGTGNTIKLINESGTSSSFNDIDYFKISTGGTGARQATESVVVKEENNKIAVYPIPSENGILTIEFDKQTSASVHLTDVTGKVVYSEHIETRKHEISTSNFNGIYFLKIVSSGKSVVQKVLIK